MPSAAARVGNEEGRLFSKASIVSVWNCFSKSANSFATTGQYRCHTKRPKRDLVCDFVRLEDLEMLPMLTFWRADFSDLSKTVADCNQHNEDAEIVSSLCE